MSSWCHTLLPIILKFVQAHGCNLCAGVHVRDITRGVSSGPWWQCFSNCDLKCFPVLMGEVTAFLGHIVFWANCWGCWGENIIWKGLWKSVSVVLTCCVFRKIWVLWRAGHHQGEWMLGDERVTDACNPHILCLFSPKEILNWYSLKTNRKERKYGPRLMHGQVGWWIFMVFTGTYLLLK